MPVTALSNRSSVMAIMEEVTEGVPVVPASGADAIALQDGFGADPAFASLQNLEIKPSIAESKPITGLESPVANFNHYLRHSGVEGVAPKFSLLLKSFFGSQTVNSTERTVAASSTTSLIKVAAGISDFKRGFAALFKIGGGYVVRPIFSVDVPGAQFVPGFNLPSAPAAGVKLGKCVNFSPVSTGHPSLSAWFYRANGGAIEMLSGARVADFSTTVEAGKLINSVFKLEGVKYHFDPIIILSTDIKLDFLDNAATRVATIAAQTYRDPMELAQAIQDAMNSLGSANTFTCVYDNVLGKFVFTSNGTTFSLLWNTGVNAANTVGDKIGYLLTADMTGALTYTSDNAQSWAFPFTPTYDAVDPNVGKSCEVLLGDPTDVLTMNASILAFKGNNSITNIEDVSSASGVSGKLITKRVVSVDFTGLLPQHDVAKFKKFRANDNAQIMVNIGVKSGGNWVPGTIVSLYIPSSVISKFKITDKNSLVIVEGTASGYVDSNGNGEFYLNML